MADNWKETDSITSKYEQISLFPDLEEKERCKDETELFLEKFHRDVQFLNAIREEFLQHKEQHTSAFLTHVTRNYLQFVKEYFMDTSAIYDNKELLEKEEDYRLLGKLFYFYLLYFKKKEHSSPFFDIMETFIGMQAEALNSIVRNKEGKQKKEEGQQTFLLSNSVSSETRFFGISFASQTEEQMELFFRIVFQFLEDGSLSFKEGYGKNHEEVFSICEKILVYLSRYVYFISEETKSREEYRVNDNYVTALENFVFKNAHLFRVHDSSLCLAKSVLMKRVAVRDTIKDAYRREKVLKTKAF